MSALHHWIWGNKTFIVSRSLRSSKKKKKNLGFLAAENKSFQFRQKNYCFWCSSKKLSTKQKVIYLCLYLNTNEVCILVFYSSSLAMDRFIFCSVHLHCITRTHDVWYLLTLSFGCTHPGTDIAAKGHQTHKISMIFTQKLTLFHVRGTASIMSFGV